MTEDEHVFVGVITTCRGRPYTNTEIVGVFKNQKNAESIMLANLCDHNDIFIYLLDKDVYPGSKGKRKYDSAIKNNSLEDIFIDKTCRTKFIEELEKSWTFPYHLIKPEYRNYDFLREYNKNEDIECEILKIKLQ